MNKLARKAVNTKNSVLRNKNAIKVAAITIPVILIQARGMKQHNEFLKENGLYEAFHALTEEA
jgi:hypothetical protein